MLVFLFVATVRFILHLSFLASAAMPDTLGSTEYAHATLVDIRILVTHVGVSHHEVVDLASHPRVTQHTNPRGVARIVGPITVRVEGPGAQNKITDCRAALIPSHFTTALTTRSLVFARPLAASVKSAIFLTPSAVPLTLPTAVDVQLKPQPQINNSVKVALAWTVDGGAAVDTVDVVIDFKLEAAGVGYV